MSEKRKINVNIVLGEDEKKEIKKKMLSGRKNSDNIKYSKQLEQATSRQMTYYVVPLKDMIELLDEVFKWGIVEEENLQEVKELFLECYPFNNEIKFFECPLKKVRHSLNIVKNELSEKNILNFRIYLSWLLYELHIYDISIYDGLETDGKAWERYEALKDESQGDWTPFRQIYIDDDWLSESKEKSED